MEKREKSLYGTSSKPQELFRYDRSQTFPPCVYIYEDELGFVILVDSLLLVAANKLLLNKRKKLVIDRFEVVKWARCREFLA